MHKAFPLPGESSQWQYKFPLPVKVVPTARRLEMPLPGVCTAIEEMMKKPPMARKPYTHQVERAKDVYGLCKIMSRQGASYFVTFTDDFSRYGYVYLLKHKHEVFETFKLFQKEVENQLGKTIKSLCSDRRGEYMSQEFLDHQKDHGIIAHRTPPYTPQHNGVSKRRNRTLLDMFRSMMSQTTLLKSFWDYALKTAARILNIVPTKKVEKTPYEVWHGKAPKLSYLKVGGYPKETIGYSFYYPLENKVIVARNAEFLENSLIDQEASGSLEDLEIIQEEDTHPSLDTSLNHEEDDPEIDEPQSDIVPIRRSTGTRHAPDRMCLYIDAEEHEKWMSKLRSSMDISMKSIPMLQSVKTYLGKCFAMKDLGEAAYILGIKIYRDKSKRLIGLCQSAYIEKILKRYCMENSKRGSIPMQKKLKLSKSQGASTPAEMKRMQNVPYASTVRSIMYDVRCTRPDVVFAQNITSRFQQNPGDIHWTTVKNILKVSCYADAGYLTDADDLKSQTGYVFVLNGGDVDWKSAKQSIFATSSAEAEYIAAFDASKEAVWVRKFISRLRVVLIIEEPISMYCDNTRAIAIANDSGITKGARHFHAKVHYLREVIQLGDIKLQKVHTDDNLADPFTKALAFFKHSKHTKNIGMLAASSLM
nr:retrotransposon protein, putative, Ty1-copia subclass [Tanacetum cinerariifolium]